MIPLFKVHMPEEALAALAVTLGGGYLAQGPRVDQFEAALGKLVAAPVLALNSGTAAIVLALRLAGVGPGDTVVTTPMTCTATNLPILAAGADPFWADVKPDSGLLDPLSVAAALEELELRGTPAKAVVCVDWGGMPCELDSLRVLAWNRGALLIEDAAHALGAVYGGRPVGSVADLTCFSFQAIKHITTGDGGALAAISPDHHRRGKLLRWYGIDRDAAAPGDSRIDVDIHEWGYKAHMNDVAATLGIAQLPHLGRILQAQAANAAFYSEALPPSFARPAGPHGVRSAWWLYTVRLPSRSERDAFREFMLARGVQVSRVHRRNDEYAVFREAARRWPGPTVPGQLPGLDEFGARMICLPVHWALTQADLDTVARGCEEFARAGG